VSAPPAVRLVHLGVEHVAGVAALALDPDVIRFTRVPDPPPDDFASTWFARYEAGRADGTREAFAIVDEDGAFLGVAVAPEIDVEAATAEFGYVVTPAARGRGVATEALRLITEWAFGEAGLERLELLISVDNAGSKRVARRGGYVFEGVRRSGYLKPGRREDTEIWSRLATDP
jgi:RimJ/RimL family protein N-acetyltransferase